MITVFADLPTYGVRGGDLVYVRPTLAGKGVPLVETFLRNSQDWTVPGPLSSDEVLHRAPPDTRPIWFDAIMLAANVGPQRYASEPPRQGSVSEMSEELIDGAVLKASAESVECLFGRNSGATVIDEHEDRINRACFQDNDTPFENLVGLDGLEPLPEAATAVQTIFPTPGHSVTRSVSYGPLDKPEAPPAIPRDPAADLLGDALKIVTGARRQSYGNPEDNFKNIADLSRAFDQAARGCDNLGRLEESGALVAIRNILQKLARIAETPAHKDSWLDIAGYAACGYRCAEKAERPVAPVKEQSHAPTQDIQNAI
jgi:hypothetical protein